MSIVDIIAMDSIFYTLFDNSTCCVGNISLPEYHLTAINPSLDFSQKDLVIPETIQYKTNNYKVISVHSFAFYNFSIKSIKLPDSIQTIGRHAFDICYIKEDLILPLQLENIFDWTFSSNSFESLYINKSLKFIANGAFAHNPKLKQIIVDERNQYFKIDKFGVLYDSSFRILYQAPTNLSEYIIPPTVHEIRATAFMKTNFSQIIIPSSVKILNKEIFRNSQIKKLYIQGNIQYGVSQIVNSKLDLFLYSGSVPIKFDIFGNNIPNKVIVCQGYLGTKIGDFEGITISKHCKSVGRSNTCKYKSSDFTIYTRNLFIICALIKL